MSNGGQAGKSSTCKSTLLLNLMQTILTPRSIPVCIQYLRFCIPQHMPSRCSIHSGSFTCLLRLNPKYNPLTSQKLRSWSGVWHPLRSSPPTRRPPQNPSPAVRAQLTPSHDPRDLPVPELDPFILARYTPLRSSNWLRISHLLHQPERPASECRSFEPPPFHRSHRQEECAPKPLLRPPETVEPCESHDGGDCAGWSGVHIDAHDGHQGAIRVELLCI